MTEVLEYAAQHKLDRIIEMLEQLHAKSIIDEEMKTWGHRIRYDVKTGVSNHIPGAMLKVHPSKLDENGYRVRL